MVTVPPYGNSSAIYGNIFALGTDGLGNSDSNIYVHVSRQKKTLVPMSQSTNWSTTNKIISNIRIAWYSFKPELEG